MRYVIARRAMFPMTLAPHASAMSNPLVVFGVASGKNKSALATT